MTPFMDRVTGAVTGGERADWPGTRPSEPRPVVIGADEQVMTRALAEQLVSEANAVLAAAGDVIELQDELSEGRLSFVMRYKARYARVSTSFERRTSVGHLHGVGAGGAGQVALDGPEQLERLILLLLTEYAPGQGGTSCNTSFASR
jgi:hypothetical protein